LPDGLKVNGDLDLRNTQIETLPPDIIVNGNIISTNTRIKSPPYVSNKAKGPKKVALDLTDDDIVDIFS